MPETIYAGRGQFMLFHKGQVVRGTRMPRRTRAPRGIGTRQHGGTSRRVAVEASAREHDGAAGANGAAPASISYAVIPSE